ncbi:polysaccharide biosynthesis tyrosine autokinase [Nesterenkonia sandarakina]|uniref:non-specific protein-tyrosine kinase n=1 Tax=Nesterenkonia sandarakina TaxID=272918 RepID=A0A2T0YF73_9MICC|nr:polysaccharide biosynthesis tyrosine autokinase [Nesterenkonia sandarakina]PRZ13402.1 capsular exopolysaccharide synthesis family protein [Nesterenkonia sandarakina]
MELHEYLRIARRGWLIIVLATLAGIGAAATFSMLQSPQYEAGTRVYVSTDSASTVAELGQGTTYTQQIVQSFVQVTATPRVLQPVIDELGLEQTPTELSESVAISTDVNTVLMQITATDEDPAVAAEIANAVTDSLIEVVGEITPGSSGEDSAVTVEVLQQAVAPETPVAPRIPLNLTLGLLAGLVLGVGIAVLREVLDTRIRGEHDIAAVTDTPLLGGISYDPEAPKRPLVVQVDPKSPRAESFRTLRTNLQFLEVGETKRSFVVTSSHQGEGKSTTVANLAITMQEAGQRVLVIDADLRRPRVADYFGLEGAVGLTNVLIGRVDLEDVVQYWGPHDLAVLPAGDIPPNPSELLGSPSMDALLRFVKEQFDVVLIDAPPLTVTDAAILATRATGAIIVVAAGRTHRHQLSRSVVALEHVGAKLFGVIPTMLPTKGPDAYGYGLYNYAYTYEEDRRA